MMERKVKSTDEFAPKYCPHCAAEYLVPRASIMDTQCVTGIAEYDENGVRGDVSEVEIMFASRQNCTECGVSVVIKSVLRMAFDDYVVSEDE